MPAGEHDNGVRLDRWLWATRFFKTRTDATDAIRAGHVLLNDQRTRPAKSVRCDDVLRIRRKTVVYTVTVCNLIDKRVSPQLATQAYAEDPISIQRRDALRQQLRLQPHPVRGSKGKPDKKERRQLQQIRYVSEGE
jgi:ribosome-associated heat shock protein Hsp15